MASALHRLQAGVRQDLRKPVGGADGNQRVLRVSGQEHWRLDRWEGSHQLVRFTYQGALLGQEGTLQQAQPVGRRAARYFVGWWR